MQEIWAHLWQFVLPELWGNTAWLLAGVGLGVGLLGISSAWLIAVYEFPGRRFLSWALLLPLALPAYITAFVWLGVLDFTGTWTTWLRETWGITSIPEIRSRGGVIVVMSLSLYPYVYLTARTAFEGAGQRLVEAAQLFGLSHTQAFWRIVLPMARPAIAAGLLLALMETLADFGTVSVFNYNTFTTAIYKAWFSMFSLPAAAQLAAILVLFVLVVALLELQLRSQYSDSTNRASASLTRLPLSGWRSMLAMAWAGGIFLLGFVMPLVQIAVWAKGALAMDWDSRYWGFAWHSVLLSGSGALLVVLCAVVLAYTQRLFPHPLMALFTRLATMGYALPGAVLAVGFYIPIAWMDNRLIDAFHFDGPVLGGTLLVMLLAYCTRFLAVGYGSVESGLGRISRGMDEAAQSLGVGKRGRLWRIHLPLLRPSLLTAAALTFVDIMKELPITLMTRPFGWDTLAVRVFEMTSEGEWERAALPALVIVLVGLFPVLYLTRSSHHAQAC